MRDAKTKKKLKLEKNTLRDLMANDLGRAAGGASVWTPSVLCTMNMFCGPTRRCSSPCTQ